MQKIVAKQGGLFGKATAKKTGTAKKSVAPRKSSSSGELGGGSGEVDQRRLG